MRLLSRPSLITAVALLLAACGSKDSNKTDSLANSVARDSQAASDPRKARVDTATASRLKSARRARTDTNPSTKEAKRGGRMAPKERTDRTPSIPVNPPLIRGPASAARPQ
jgi:hypothetical protein